MRVPLQYSIIDDPERMGSKVNSAPDLPTSMWQFVHSKGGSVITPPQKAHQPNEDARLKGRFTIHQHPVKSTAYFMVFSTTNPGLNSTDREQI